MATVVFAPAQKRAGDRIFKRHWTPRPFAIDWRRPLVAATRRSKKSPLAVFGNSQAFGIEQRMAQDGLGPSQAY
jgi:hypothetical protein